MNRTPVIDDTLVADGLLFATHGDRCRYLGKSRSEKPHWLKENEGRFRRIDDIEQEFAHLGPPVEDKNNVGAASAGPNCETSSRDVRKDDDDEDDVALVDTQPGDCSPPYLPTSPPTPVKTNVSNGSTKAEPLPHAQAAVSEANGPQTKPGRSGDRQLKKQKPPSGISKSGPKLSPERMRIVLDSLAEYPIKGHAAMKAGIFRKTLDYWLKGSAAGRDQYDVEWGGETWKFHEHFAAAIDESDDKLYAAMRHIGMGGVVYKNDEVLLSLGYEGPNAYLRDEYGDPVVEIVRKANLKVLRLLLEWKRPDQWGKRRRIDVPRECGVLVVGDSTKKKLENSSAASVKARKWKSYSRMIRKAKP